jgi:hypothetical protein
MKFLLRPWLLPFVLIAACSGFAQAQEVLSAKQVAAPASDVRSGLVRLPEAWEHPTRSRAGLIQVEFTRDEQAGWTFETTLPLGAAGPLSVGLLMPDAAEWRLRARGDDGVLSELEGLAGVGGVERRAQTLFEELPGWRILRYDVAQASAGSWTLHVEVPGARAVGAPPTGFLIVRDASPVVLAVHTSTRTLTGDSEIGLVARLFDEDTGRALTRAVHSARAIVRTERGTTELSLHDDGRHGDGAPGDGVFGALLPRGAHGEVRALIEVRGIDENGGELLRGAQLHFSVLERRVLLDGAASMDAEDGQRLRIELGALPLGPADRLQVAAEVWGTGEDGERVPVCWLARMQEPEARGGEWRLQLFLDRRWLDFAGASAPLELRNVRVQDPDTQVPFDLVDRIPLEAGTLLEGPGRERPSEVTWQMLTGLPSGSFLTASGGPSPSPWGPRALMLVHGYCSGGSIWPAADFTQPKKTFLDPNANRSHDQFSRLLAKAGAELYSFGVVAHSQGGAAALHLLTYYSSPLDRAFGPRRIQSLATPYQGTPLASLGSFACGVNDNMTPSGAAAWLAGIPSWARAEVSYWTTSNSGPVCNLLTSLFLSAPQDGTVEQFRGQLPGAHNMGHVTGWCHTTGMSNPAGYTDSARNLQMNAQAAR